MLKISTFGSGLVWAAIFLLASSTVQAGDDCDRRCKQRRPKGDVESLKAKLDWRDGEWFLHIRYKLEIKYAHSHDAIELVFTPTECGHALADGDGRLISLAVSTPVAGNPCDDDKIKFRDEVTMRLPDGLMRDPCRLRVRAELIDRNRNRLLDDESTKVKLCRVPCEVVAVNVQYETRYEVYSPPPPPVVYVEPVPVFYPPPVIYHHYVRSYRPVYNSGPRFYPGRSFGYRTHDAWGREWGRGGAWCW